MSIIIPIDWHSEELPPAPLDEDWLAQIPPAITKEHPAKLVLLEGWRHRRRKTRRKSVKKNILRQLARKELRRAELSGADYNEILDCLARFWVAAERCLDRERPAAILLWNCGNADQNLWAMLAEQRHIPVMHTEHGWLPHTRIFDPRGGYVTGRSGWDALPDGIAGGWRGAAIIDLWRKGRQSKHEQGGEPSDQVREFCGTGPALLVARQLDSDGAAVYHESEFDCQRAFIRKCLSWPGPVLVKAHPVAEGIEWEPTFAEERRVCQMEVEAKGAMWLDANQSIHDLLPMVAAVTAINSNVLLEAAMMGKPALSFGQGPHSGRGFTVDMGAGDAWPSGEQTPEQWAAVCRQVGRMETYLSPHGAWLSRWRHTAFWGWPFWENAQEVLQERWELLF